MLIISFNASAHARSSFLRSGLAPFVVLFFVKQRAWAYSFSLTLIDTTSEKVKKMRKQGT